MPQIVNLLLVIFGVIAFGAGLAGLRSNPASLLALMVGIALVVLAYFSDRRRERRVEELKHAAARSRLDELVRRTWGPGDSLQVPGSIWLVPGTLLLAAAGAGALYMGVTAAKQDWIFLVVGSCLLGIGTLALARALTGIGRPALELTSSGVVMPVNGRVAWRDVSGIFLYTVTQRSGAKSFRLMFRVERFARAASHVHWTDRLLAVFRLGALARGMVSVGLPHSKEDPEAVHALARLLWKQATGNDYDWNPLMSDPYNEALQRMDALTARMQEPGAVEASLADLRRMSQDMAQLDRDMALIAGEQKRRLAKLRWTIGFLVLLALLGAAWPWLKTMLSH